MSQRAAFRKRYRSRSYVPWIVLFLTLLSTAAAWFIANDLAYQRDINRFRSIYEVLQSAIEEKFNDQSQLGLATAAFMGSRDANRQDFDDFLTRQRWPDQSPQVGTISFLVHVPPGGGQRFLDYARKHGVSDAVIDRTRDRLDRVLILYRLPVEVGMPAPGFDATSMSTRNAAIRLARDGGESIATEPVVLGQDQKRKEPAVVIFVPIYSKALPPVDSQDRSRSIVGFIGVGIRMAEVLKKILSRGGSQQPFVTIRDASAAPSSNLLFTNLPSINNSRFHFSRDLPMFGRTWSLQYFSSPAFDSQSGADASAFILGGGFIFALVLFFLTNSQATTQLELAGYAEEIEQRSAADRLLAHAGSLFSNSDNYHEILSQIGQSAVPSLADLCSVDVLEDGEIREIGLYSEDPAELEAARQINLVAPVELTDEYGIGQALRTGKSSLVPEVTPASLEATHLPPELARYVESRGFTSAMFIPVSVRGVVFGSLTLITGPGRRTYTPTDLRQMEEVAERIGLAIDNSRLFRSAQLELERKDAAEEALRILNEELEQVVTDRTRELSVAVEELEAFCYSVSHDLRAPLRSVDGFSKALMEDYRGRIDPEGVDYLNRIRAAARRMDQLISAMLTLSRLTRADITPVDVDVSAITEEIAHDQDNAESVEFVIQEEMRAWADPQMLRILLENLIANAIKFSSKVAAPKVEIGKKGDVFFVKDNGAGFDPRYSSKLFHPFERLHTPKEFPGTGIGLATVSRIVKRHGGQIWAESRPENGATFFFTLAPEGE